jgi:acyl-CoA thioesterase
MIKTESLFTVTRLGDDHYTAELNQEISIFGNPNGGYLMGLAILALYDLNPSQVLVTVTGYFMASPRLNNPSIDIKPHLLKRGKTLTFWSVDICQGDALCIRISAIMSPRHGLNEHSHMLLQPIDIKPIEQCQSIQIPRIAEGLGKSIVYTMEPEDIANLKLGEADTAEHVLWMEFHDKAKLDAWHIVFLVDAMFPPIFHIKGMTAWVPTLELTLQLRQLPKTTHIACHFKSQALTMGIVEEDAQVWDGEGNLVALCRQTAYFNPG